MNGSIFLFILIALLLVACERKDEVDLSSLSVEVVNQGVTLIPTYCNTCHVVAGKDIDEMLAPPLWGVRAHYLAKFPQPEAFVDAMSDFIMDPQVDKSLLTFEVKKYGLKPPISLTPEKIRAAVWAIYAGRVDRPSWSREYIKRHGDCEAVW